MITDTLPAAAPQPLLSPTRVDVVSWFSGSSCSLSPALLGSEAWWPDRGEDVRSGTTLVDAEGLAARYGIDVSMIGVTAAGGMVDFRYQAVDPEKADGVLHDDDLLPILVVERSGETLAFASPPHHHNSDIRLGATYFFLFANAHNAVHAGDLVTLVLGDVRVEHIVAQG